MCRRRLTRTHIGGRPRIRIEDVELVIVRRTINSELRIALLVWYVYFYFRAPYLRSTCKRLDVSREAIACCVVTFRYKHVVCIKRRLQFCCTLLDNLLCTLSKFLGPIMFKLYTITFHKHKKVGQFSHQIWVCRRRRGVII